MTGFDWGTWNAFYDEQVSQGRCPYSGATIRDCHLWDVCDCFDFEDDTPYHGPPTAVDDGDDAR